MEKRKRVDIVRNIANFTDAPKVQLIFFKDDKDRAPVLEWLGEIPAKALDKCTVRMERLALLGHDLRRPEADLLRDKIYELRIGLQGINYRILYFFHGNTAAILAHAIIKEKEVPDKEINLAIARRKQFEADPDKHTYTDQGETDEEN